MSTSFIDFYGTSIIKHKNKRYVKGFVALVLGLLTIYLFCFVGEGIKYSYQSQIYNRGDSYSFSLSRNLSFDKEGLSIVKTEAPSIKEGEGLRKYVSSLKVGYDISYFFNENLSFESEDKIIYAKFIPIESLNKNIKIKGRMFSNLFSEVIVNEAFIKELNTNKLNININKSVINLVNDSYIEDEFIYKETLSIVGVIEEFSFMSTPTVYYSYQKAIDYLQNHYLYNFSIYQNEVITWYDYLVSSSLESGVKGYCIKLFVKDSLSSKILIDIFTNIKSDQYILESTSKEIYEVLTSMHEIINSLLVIIISICSGVLICIISYLNFTFLMEDTHDIGIIFSLGCSKNIVCFAYILISILLGVISILTAVILSILSSFIFNPIINQTFGLANLINISKIFPLTIIFIFVISVVFSLITWLVFKTTFKNEVDILIREE